MATDPVSAFLTGFRAVDQYETNKQMREFAKEEMSWQRKMWKQQEKVWAQEELNRYREQKYAEFNARVDDIINSVPKEEIETWFSDSNTKNGQITGFAKITNQVMKEMVAADPGFAEHVALALDFDAYNGPLVRDKRKPLSAIGIHPEYGMWFEVDSVNGPQPATENRSSAANDRVIFRQPGLKELVGIFGPQASNSQLAITRLMHSQLGIKRDGSPTETTSTTKQQPQSRGPNVIEGEFTDETPPEEGQGQQGGAATTDGGNFTASDIETAGLTPEQVSQMTTAEFQAAWKENAMSGRTEKPSDIGIDSETGSFDPFAYTKNQAEPETQTVGEAFSSWMRGGYDEEKGRWVGGNEEDAIAAGVPYRERKVDWLSWFREPENSPWKAGEVTTDKEATKPKDVKPEQRGQLTNIKTEEDANTAITNGEAPATPEVAQGMANQLLNSQGKKPTFVELYNAVGLAKLKVISSEQLLRYAQTGQFDETAKWQMFQIGNSVVSVGQSKADGSLQFGGAMQIGGPDSGSDILKIRTQLQNYYDKVFGGLPDEYRQNSINAHVGAMTLLGFGAGDAAARSDDQLLTASNQAASLLARFDWDYVQGLVDGNEWYRKLDLWPLGDRQFLGDYKPPINQGTVAVGIMLTASGISSPREFTRAFVEYQEGLKDQVSYMPDGDFARYVGAIETEISDSIKTGKPVPVIDPRTNKVIKRIEVEGKSREKIRTEVVDALVLIYKDRK